MAILSPSLHTDLASRSRQGEARILTSSWLTVALGSRASQDVANEGQTLALLAVRAPAERRARVLDKRGFASAAITFCSVIYEPRREGLVKRSSDSFRSAYAITPKGRDELLKAVSYLDEIQKNLTQA